MNEQSSHLPPGAGRGLDTVSAELAVLGARITALSGELNAHRHQVHHQQAHQHQASAPASQWTGPRQAPAYPPAPQQPGPIPPPALGPPSDRVAGRPRRSLSSTAVLAWTGGAVTLLGVVLALVLAVQRGYLGPLPRVLGGAGLATALLAVGARLYPRPHGRTGGLTLAATGVAALYLDIVAATALYEFLPAYAGLLLGFAVALGGLTLAARWDSPFFACFVVLCCAAAVPVLTGLSLVLPAFLLALKGATIPVVLRRRWTPLALCAAVPALLAILVVELAEALGVPRSGMSTAGMSTAGTALAVTVVFCAFAVTLVRRAPADRGALGMLAAAAVPTLLAVPLLPPGLGAALAGVVAAGMTGLWLHGRRGSLPRAGVAIVGSVAGLAGCHATLVAAGPSGAAVPLLVEALVLTVIAARLLARGAWITSVAYAVLGWVLALVNTSPPLLVLVPTAPPAGAVLLAAASAALGTVVAILVTLTARTLGVLPGDPAEAPWPWGPTALLVLWGSAATVVELALAVSPGERGFVAGHVLVTVGWVGAGLTLLLRRGEDTVWRVTGLTLAGASVLKLLLFDLATLDGLPRVVAALGAGLVLLLAGARYARRSAESTRAEPTPSS